MIGTADQAAIQSVIAKFQRGDLAGARADCHHFLATVATPVRQAPLRFWLGAIEQRGGDLPAAIEQFELALTTDRHNPRILLQLGTAHLQCKDLDQAETCYREAIQQDPHSPLAYYNLGVVLQQKQDLQAAQGAFESALVHQPNFPEALTNLANILVTFGDDVGAAQRYQQALSINPAFVNALHGLGLLHRRGNRRGPALQCFEAAVQHDPLFIEAWLDLAETHYSGADTARAIACVDEALKRDPGNATAGFKRAQYHGEQPAEIPHQVVERLYAGMAGSFDAHLVQHLGYRTPALLIEALKPWLEEFTACHGRAPSVLDLGCGTGLFGVAVRPYAARLVGIDLSAEMLAKAAERAIYDELTKSDVLSYLRNSPSAPDLDRIDATGRVELIAASDVLIYVGSLDQLLDCVAERLSAGGVFAFSLESPPDLTVDFRLEPSGRYAHHPDYVRRLSASLGLEIFNFAESVIRTEGGMPIKGSLFVLKKVASQHASSATA